MHPPKTFVLWRSPWQSSGAWQNEKIPTFSIMLGCSHQTCSYHLSSEPCVSALLHPRCGAESLDDFAQHFAEQSLDELESIDVSSLANAFSRVSCRNKAFLQRLGDRLCADASSTLLPPVATTMALNAFAVLKHCDKEQFTVLVNNAVRTLVGPVREFVNRGKVRDNAMQFSVPFYALLYSFVLSTP